MTARNKVLAGPPGPRAARIIGWDLETGPNEGRFFQLFNKRPLNHAAIQKERYIICGSWKLLGEREVHSVCVSPRKPRDDEKCVRTLHSVLSSADAVFAHYGDQFDMPMFNARAIYYGLPPLPPVITIDTYRIARARFRFNNNRLDYLGAYLGIGRKRETPPNLWDRCIEGDPKALKTMVAYNRNDVFPLLEKVFLKLYPWSRFKINAGAFANAAAHEICAHCGGSDMKYKGTQLARTLFHEAYQCGDCGAWRMGPAVKKEASKRGKAKKA